MQIVFVVLLLQHGRYEHSLFGLTFVDIKYYQERVKRLQQTRDPFHVQSAAVLESMGIFCFKG